MSCHYYRSDDQRGQPPAQVNQMPGIKELNPRLMEAAMKQLEMMNQPEISNVDSITITIKKRMTLMIQ